MIKPWLIECDDLFELHTKPIELYFFIDPFCINSWSLTSMLKKLQLEYGEYFTLKYVLCGNLQSLNCKETINEESAPYLAAISIKAAELQGKQAGARFIQQLQESYFINNENVTDIHILQDCAKRAKLDLQEFKQDIYSTSAAKAFQCDLKISAEMEVEEMPTMVFFNENIEDEGLKITGTYSYSIYVQILSEMLDKKPSPRELPSLENYLSRHPFSTVEDLAFIFDQPIKKIECKLKKLQLQQKVRKIHTRHGEIWQYTINQ